MNNYGLGHRERSLLLPNLTVGAGILWAFVCFFIFAHQVGTGFDFHPALGNSIALLGLQTYSPLTVWQWPAEFWQEPLVDERFRQALMTFSLPLVVVVGLIASWSRRPRAIEDLHGSAHWASRKEIREMGYFDGKGVYVGGYWDKRTRRQLYLRHDGPEHVLCFAPTRSGKGVGLILPTLLSWPGSSVVLDIKGENYALTSGWLQSQGNRVLRLDPADPSRTATRFNPLAEIRLDTERGIADVQQIVTMVLDPAGKGLEDYWNKAAFGFLGGAMLHCLIVTHARERRCASLYDVSVMLEDPKRTDGVTALFEEMIATDHAELLRQAFPGISRELCESMHIFCASAASGMLTKADKEMAGVVSTATANLSLYRDPVVAWNTGASDFRITDLMNQGTPFSLYLVILPADINRLRPLLRIFANQLLGRLTEQLNFDGGRPQTVYKHRLLLMLDEFTTLGRLAIIEQAVAYMAGYGIKGYFIVQDTKQLAGTYGQDNALMANCHVRIAYAPTIPETAEYLSKLTGTTTVVQRKRSLSSGKGGGGSSTSIQETARPLLTPDECLRLPGIHMMTRGLFRKKSSIAPGDMLIFTAGRPPIYGRQILHFQDPVFLERAKIAPADSKKEKRSTAAEGQLSVEQEAANEYLRYLEDLPEHIARGAV